MSSAESIFSLVLCLNKCKRRHSSPLKKCKTSLAQIDAEGVEFDVLQAEFLGGAADVGEQVTVLQAVIRQIEEVDRQI